MTINIPLYDSRRKASMPKLGDVLAEARKKLELSLREAAERVKKEDGSSVSPQYLNDIEHGRRVPSSAVLDGLAKAFGLESDYLHWLAGALPPNLQNSKATEGQVMEAYAAFRRKLGH
jgi:transcriptional regulator with XRE-family HTH domain